MRAILRHKGEVLILTLTELTPPGWFAASVEVSRPEDPPEQKPLLALPAPAPAPAAQAPRQTVISNLKSGIYRYLPKNPHDGHLNGVLRLREHLRKKPLKGATPLNQLWEEIFQRGDDGGAFRLAVAALGHGKHWTISEGRSPRGNRRIFFIGPK